MTTAILRPPGGVRAGGPWYSAVGASCVVLLIWLAFDRLAFDRALAVMPADPVALRRQAAAIETRDVAALAAAFPADRVAEALARLGQARADVVGGGPHPLSQRAPRSYLSPVVLFRVDPHAITADQLVRNVFLNPRDEPMLPVDVATLATLLAIYRDQLELATAELERVRRRVLLEDVASGRLPTVASLGLDVGETARSGDDAALATAMRGIACDAWLRLEDGNVFVAPLGSLRGAVVAHQDYCDFLREDFFARTLELFARLGLLSQGQSAGLMRAYREFATHH